MLENINYHFRNDSLTEADIAVFVSQFHKLVLKRRAPVRSLSENKDIVDVFYPRPEVLEFLTRSVIGPNTLFLSEF